MDQKIADLIKTIESNENLEAGSIRAEGDKIHFVIREMGRFEIVAYWDGEQIVEEINQDYGYRYKNLTLFHIFQAEGIDVGAEYFNL